MPIAVFQDNINSEYGEGQIKNVANKIEKYSSRNSKIFIIENI